MTSSLCFLYLSVKLVKDNLQHFISFRLIANSKFHKICKFKNHVTRNDIIMMSLPKTIEKQCRNASHTKFQLNSPKRKKQCRLSTSLVGMTSKLPL